MLTTDESLALCAAAAVDPRGRSGAGEDLRQADPRHGLEAGQVPHEGTPLLTMSPVPADPTEASGSTSVVSRGLDRVAHPSSTS